MNWLIIILIYLTNVMSEKNLFCIKKAYFLEHNFWSDDQRQDKTDKGYLFKVIISVKGDNSSRYGVEYDLTNCHYFKSTKLRYAVLDEWMMKDILHSKAYDDKCFLRFIFLFTDKSIQDHKCFKICESDVKLYKTYKLLEKMSENSMTLKSEELEIRMYHIKERFKGFAYIKLLKLNEYILKISEKKLKEKLENIKDDVKFKFYYFNSPFECLKNLQIFVKEIRCFKLVEENVLPSNLTGFVEISIDSTTTMQGSKFTDQLYEKCLNKIDTFDFDVENKSMQTLKFLFKKCCNHLKTKLLENHFLFLIGNEYTIDFYLDKFCDLIYESLELDHVKQILKIKKR
ncbi:hypothetical protein NBO_40g0002 [Nosema bombycis CQ1]|uniref:Uncharacterized protein n=1 Tax=Nosema bombycis (strain CQ1 / CVCC 102059) TaxID=578461 RepID=R0KTE3_NOSB1|nr:hypothetical protein NBO_40g0002 [Nosema bombycis CQ1]|eukprot:EOB14081.1 hypothetical protein NBO_40g0002 [Nosema bombycis CQ1]